MQIAKIVLPATNPWHSQDPPQLVQPGIVPCDQVINSSSNTIAVTQAQTPQALQAPHLQLSTSGNPAVASLGKIGLTQSNSIIAAGEPSSVPNC